MASNRIVRINEEVKKELSEIIRDLKDPRIPMMTSVVAVSVTPDLRYAKAYISVFGDDDKKQSAIQALKKSAGYVRREIGRRINLRYTPEFVFALDSSIEHGAKINQLLHDVAEKK
ncbi:MAG: 30S ribosome-binding factor RbfA [Clostridia bacterium]|nr:30S ribosome-binding factor RbfA [Clostridia bacterium]MBR6647709.1 30S ribosome-binding factor RbfA [Clostridia bacterium]